MNQPVHRSPLAAWNHLVKHGGLELEDRDEGLEWLIRQRLNPLTASLQEALEGTTMERFAVAFFEAIQPFVEMYRDILAFFEKANATQGADQWVLQLGDVELNLDHFRNWIEQWTHVGKSISEVHAIDRKTVWDLLRVFARHCQADGIFQQSSSEDPLNLPADVQVWLKAHNQGTYLALPTSLVSPECPPGLAKAALIAKVILSRIREFGFTRKALMDFFRASHIGMNQSDAFDLLCIAQNETDFWLRSFVLKFATAINSLTSTELQSLGLEIDVLLCQFPLRPFNTTVSLASLESVLSLPMWKKRYELYSVWVTTEIVRALNKHEIEIHHDNGRIPFAFRETILATIHSSPGPFTLICERRTALLNPRGEGRTGGVQPDHGLWTIQSGDPVCRLVIEVKHYKSSAKARFIDLFEDYARALPQAQVFLVSHGPIGNAADHVRGDLHDRCHAISNLTTFNLAGRQQLYKAVLDCVGDPIEVWLPSSRTRGHILAIDVSNSMQTMLTSPAMAPFFRKFIKIEEPSELVAINTAITGSWPPTEEGFAKLIQSCGGSTNLTDSILELCGRNNKVSIITDDDGFSCLKGIIVENHPAESQAPNGIRVGLCSVNS